MTRKIYYAPNGAPIQSTTAEIDGMPPQMIAGVMPKLEIEEFSCSDGSSGLVVLDRFIFLTECSVRVWSEQYVKEK